MAPVFNTAQTATWKRRMRYANWRTYMVLRRVSRLCRAARFPTVRSFKSLFWHRPAHSCDRPIHSIPSLGKAVEDIHEREQLHFCCLHEVAFRELFSHPARGSAATCAGGGRAPRMGAAWWGDQRPNGSTSHHDSEVGTGRARRLRIQPVPFGQAATKTGRVDEVAGSSGGDSIYDGGRSREVFRSRESRHA